MASEPLCSCQDPGDNPACALHFPRTRACPVTPEELRFIANEIDRRCSEAFGGRSPEPCLICRKDAKRLRALADWLPAAAAASEPTRGAEGPHPRDLLVHLREWLAGHREVHTRYFPDTDQSGHPHGYDAVCIPVWDLRQRLDDIEAALKPRMQTAPNTHPQDGGPKEIAWEVQPLPVSDTGTSEPASPAAPAPRVLTRGQVEAAIKRGGYSYSKQTDEIMRLLEGA